MSDRIVLPILALLALVGVSLAILFHDQALPVASIDFKVLQGEAESRARAYLQARGLDLSGLKVVVSFTNDQGSQGYLERQVGVGEMSRLGRDAVVLWYWRVRFYRPLQTEEYSVLVDPTGRIDGFDHTIPEATPGPALDSDAARALAENYLQSDRGRDLANYDLISSDFETRPNGRRDHTFVWERRGFKIGEATDRLRVSVQGDRVDGYRQYVKVPEESLRHDQLEHNRGAILVRAGWTCTYLLALALGWLFLTRLRAQAIRWRFALGLAALGGVVGLAAGLNSLPLLLADYPTTSDLPSYLFSQALNTLGQYLPEFGIVLVAGVTGAALWRERRSAALAPDRQLSPSGIGLSSSAKAIVVGYLAAAAWFGVVTLYYWLGSRWLGFWSPAELPYRDLLSTFAPVVYPLTVGIGAAVGEELIYRLFAIPCLLLFAGWLLGRRAARTFLLVAAAVILPAVIWGSLHSTYPQQPFYVRAIEVSAAGIGAGWLFLRYGILATLVNHYVANASIVGALLLLSGNPVLQVSASVAIAWPSLLLIPWLIRRLPGRRGEPAVAVAPVNGVALAAPPPGPVLTGEEGKGFPLLSRGGGWGEGSAAFALIVLILGLLALGATALWPAPRQGDAVSVQIDRAAAGRRADAFLRAQGADPGAWQRTVAAIDAGGGLDATYLLRQLGVAAADRVLMDDLGARGWQVRYFRSLDKEEYRVRVGFDGQITGYSHALEETAPGSDLPQDQARTIAEAFLGRQGLDRPQYTLKTATSERREARVDHSFTWERNPGAGVPAVGEATFRTTVVVAGDQVGDWSRWLKLPEPFTRELSGTTGFQAATGGLQAILTVVLAVLLVVVFVRRYLQNRLAPRFGLGVGLALVAAQTLLWLNRLPVLLAGYGTTLDLPMYVVGEGLSLVAGLAQTFAQTFALAALLGGLYRERFPGDPTPGAAQRVPGPARGGEKARSPLAHQLRSPSAGALCAGLGLALLAWGASTLAAGVVDAWGRGTLRPETVTALGTLNSLWPALHAVLRAALNAAPGLLAAGVAFLWLWERLRRPWLAAALILLGAALLNLGGAQTPAEALPALLGTLVFGALGGLLAARALGGQAAGYVAAVGTFLIGRDTLFLVRQPDLWLRLNGLLLVGLWLGLLAWGVARGPLTPRPPLPLAGEGEEKDSLSLLGEGRGEGSPRRG